MKIRGIIRFVMKAGCAAAGLLVSASAGLAQCAMCRNALTNSPTAQRLSESINIGVLVLLIPPVAIFCGIFIAAFKYRKAQGKVTSEGTGKMRLGAWWGRLSVFRRRRGQSARGKHGAIA